MNIVDLPRVEKTRSILIVRYFSLGDIALSLPIIHSLRRNFPESRISYLCWARYSETLKGVNGLDEIITMTNSPAGLVSVVRRLRKERFDIALDLLSSPGSSPLTRFSGARLRIGMDTGRHNWCYHHVLPRGVIRDGKHVKCYTMDSNREIAVLLGLEEKGRWEDSTCNRDAGKYDIGFPAAQTEAVWAEEYFGTLGDPAGRFAGIVPDAKYHSKSWPEKNFIRLAGMLGEQLGLRAVVLWGPGEEGMADRITAAVPGAVKSPPMGIARLGAVINRLTVLVGVDSGPKHLAVMQGIPTVTLFGPTDPRVWDPMTQKHRVIFRELPCSPCRDRNCVENLCMSKISPEEVVDAVRLVI